MPAPRFDLVVRGGTVVGARRTRRADVGITDGRIAAIGPLGGASGRTELPADDLVVLPGGVDGHTHLAWEKFPAGERTADDHFSGTVAAAAGGVTTIVDYARQRPGATLHETIADRMSVAAADAIIDVAFHLVPTDESAATLAEIPDLVRGGFPGYKVFLNRASDDWVRALMEAVGQAGGLLMLHCETAEVIEAAMARLTGQGRASARHWAEARPPESEVRAVRRAIGLCRSTGTPVCLVHLSTAASMAEVRAARRAGLPVFVETRPGYLLMTEERYAEPDPRHLWYTGSPPLREARSVEALWTAIRRRTIDLVASDHAAYTIDQKRRGDHDLGRLPVGMPSLETQLAALYSAGVGGGRISLRRLAEVTATNPARLFGLYPRKGVIAVGSDADLVLLDPQQVRTIRAVDLHSRAGHEPLEGETVTGWPVATVARGEVIVRNGTVLGRRGRGAILRRAAYDPAEHRPSGGLVRRG